MPPSDATSAELAAARRRVSASVTPSVSILEEQASNLEEQASNLEEQASNLEEQASNLEEPTSASIAPSVSALREASAQEHKHRRSTGAASNQQ